MTRFRREIQASALVSAMLLAACASTPPPTGLLDEARRAVADAREARADDHAPVELGFAEEKLAGARAAMEARDYATAASLASQAELNAQLAAARSRAATGRAAVQAQSEENARLRRELLGEGGRP
jgi:predicted S18 family serine protease